MSHSTAIVCIGEFLWDMLPVGWQPGGAPLHVALHLQQLGQAVQLISRVGDDELGSGLLAFMAKHGLSADLVQRSETHPTSMVKVNWSAGQPTYKIVLPVAWDYLQHTDQLRAAVADARMLVYGSLAARSATSRETLYRLLQVAPYKVFDVNLRPPHYSRWVVQYLLQQAHLVKLNQQELTEIMTWLGQPDVEDTALPWLAAHFNLEAVCLTKGAAGVTLWHDNHLVQHPGWPGSAPNAPGGNDAFLAALLANWPTGNATECLRKACAAAASATAHSSVTTVLAPADSNYFPSLTAFPMRGLMQPL